MIQNARALPPREPGAMPPVGAKPGAIIGCICGRDNVVIGVTIGCIIGWEKRKFGGKAPKAGVGGGVGSGAVWGMSGALSPASAAASAGSGALRLGFTARVPFFGGDLQKTMQQRQRSAPRINEAMAMAAFCCQQSRYASIKVSKPCKLHVVLVVLSANGAGANGAGGVVGKYGGGVEVVVVRGGGAVAARGCGQ